MVGFSLVMDAIISFVKNSFEYELRKWFAVAESLTYSNRIQMLIRCEMYLTFFFESVCRSK